MEKMKMWWTLNQRQQLTQSAISWAARVMAAKLSIRILRHLKLRGNARVHISSVYIWPGTLNIPSFSPFSRFYTRHHGKRNFGGGSFPCLPSPLVLEDIHVYLYHLIVSRLLILFFNAGAASTNRSRSSWAIRRMFLRFRTGSGLARSGGSLDVWDRIGSSK